VAPTVYKTGVASTNVIPGQVSIFLDMRSIAIPGFSFNIVQWAFSFEPSASNFALSIHYFLDLKPF